MTLYEVEKVTILNALELHKNNRTHTAKYLDIGLRTLQRKLQAYTTEGSVIPLWNRYQSSVDVVTNF